MYAKQLTRQDSLNEAERVRKALAAKVPGVFTVGANTWHPRVECKGLGGVYCGWSSSHPNDVVGRAYRHFLHDH